MSGLIHLYHGEGKGKTTAAIGLAVRAAGHGMNVVFVQFLKGSPTGELSVLNTIRNITVLRNPKDFGFLKNMSSDQIKEITDMHNSNLKTAFRMVYENCCDLLVLDEICAAFHSNVIDRIAITNFIKNKPDSLELVLTGRNPDKIFLEYADYITEKKNVRHPLSSHHISARRGIEY